MCVALWKTHRALILAITAAGCLPAGPLVLAFCSSGSMLRQTSKGPIALTAKLVISCSWFNYPSDFSASKGQIAARLVL